MKKESRGKKYGRNFAVLINYVFSTVTNSKEDQKDYKKQFFKELNTYSFEARKKGSPRNSGTVHELKDIDKINIKKPEDLAKLVKGGVHLMYQKETAGRMLDGFLGNI